MYKVILELKKAWKNFEKFGKNLLPSTGLEPVITGLQIQTKISKIRRHNRSATELLHFRLK